MHNLWVNEIQVRMNSIHLDEFYKVAEYLHTKHRKNCFYDKSAPFKYLISEFNNEFNDYPKGYWLNIVDDYNSKLKKDIKTAFWIRDLQYDNFMRNCNKLKLNRAVVIRCLMLKLIDETKIEEAG